MKPSYDLLLLTAIASANIHPAGGAGYTVGGLHLVIDRRHTGDAQGVDITKGALVVALGIFF